MRCFFPVAIRLTFRRIQPWFLALAALAAGDDDDAYAARSMPLTLSPSSAWIGSIATVPPASWTPGAA